MHTPHTDLIINILHLLEASLLTQARTEATHPQNFTELREITESLLRAIHEAENHHD